MSRPFNPKQSVKEKYILIWDIKLTLLEKYILKVIKQKAGCTDEEIAAVLCIETKEISQIIDDEGLRDHVQGDASRRTLVNGFIAKESNVVVSIKNNKNNKIEYRECEPKRKGCLQNDLDVIEKCRELDPKGINQQLKNLKAYKYYLYNENIHEELVEIFERS